MRDGAVADLLNQIVIHIHKNQDDKLAPVHGYFSTIGNIVLYLRRDAGERHRLSYWPRLAGSWEAVFNMDSLLLIRDHKPSIDAISVESTDSMEIRIDRSENAFHRDLLYMKMVLSA